MKRGVVVVIGLGLASLSLARDEAPAPVEPPAPSAWVAFQDVAAVLQHPRCQNCHPAGDAPLQGEAGRPHHMKITRRSPELGLRCDACHRATTMPGERMPPGVPGWAMPPADTRMIFEGRTPAALCAQLKDPTKNGDKTLAELLHHVEHDALVLYGWAPGDGRAPVPTPHARFVARMRQWVEAGAPCAEP